MYIINTVILMDCWDQRSPCPALLSNDSYAGHNSRLPRVQRSDACILRVVTLSDVCGYFLRLFI